MLQSARISVEGNFELSVRIKNAVTTDSSPSYVSLYTCTCQKLHVVKVIYVALFIITKNEAGKKNKCQSKGKLTEYHAVTVESYSFLFDDTERVAGYFVI